METKLLAVEDNRNIADIIRHVSVAAGFETRIAHTDQEFTSLYDSFAPDILVLDIMMPDMDGFEILTFLKERRSRADIVILSGQEGYRHMAERLGKQYGLSICANIAKPFRVEALRQTLEDIRNRTIERPKQNGEH